MTIKTKVLNFLRRIFTIRPFENMLLAFVRHSRYMGLRSRFVPNPILYKFGTIRNVTRNGIKYELDMSCMMQWYVYWDYSAKDRNKLYSLVKEGDVIFDVGTNVGETLLNFAKLTGGNGYVYGFEPDEKNYTGVAKNIALNSFKNLEVFKVAVSDKHETVKLYCVEPHNRGMNRILQQTDDAGLDYTIMETTTLDDIVEMNKIDRLNLIKIDIEGYEMHALRGARQVLKRFKPVLFVEVGYTRLLMNKTSPGELIRFLETHGYEVYHSETEKKVTEAYDFSYIGDGSIDVVAIPK